METGFGLYPAVDSHNYPAWLQTLVSCKERFLHYDEDPRNMTCLRRYVAESWLRSKNYGIDPYARTLGKKLPASEAEKLRKKNAELIQLVCSLIEPFRTMLERFDYGFAVTDKNGVFLYIDGSDRTGDFFDSLNAGIGSVWREDLVGTTAHSLSLLYKCPILLLGPEHYCLAFQNTISASAPILDENEELMGTLIVATLLHNKSWESCYEMINYHIHTLYLVIAMARAIESQNRVNKREAYLKNLGTGLVARPRPAEKEHSGPSGAKFTMDDLLGDSQAFRNAKQLAQLFAKSKEPVLLTGESGTGKELFAQAIHNLYCPGSPFIVVNCAGIPKELVESEFFGYEGGSFTGASREGKPGKIELAHGGTLFLDEIGDMPLELQAVLLRALEYKQIMRIGGKNYINVDFRLISATNQDLSQLVREKRFREDLYFRISVLTIDIPPLRERGNDINLLTDHFIRKHCRELGKKPLNLSQSARKRINEYPWPGNVRQLQNALIHAIIVAQKETIGPEHLPRYLAEWPFAETGTEPDRQPLQPVKKELISFDCLEKETLEKVLAKTKYNVAKAANLLGVSKSTMYRKLKKHHIEF